VMLCFSKGRPGLATDTHHIGGGYLSMAAAAAATASASAASMHRDWRSTWRRGSSDSRFDQDHHQPDQSITWHWSLIIPTARAQRQLDLAATDIASASVLQTETPSNTQGQWDCEPSDQDAHLTHQGRLLSLTVKPSARRPESSHGRREARARVQNVLMD
jgi:type II secretory pathway component PulK